VNKTSSNCQDVQQGELQGGPAEGDGGAMSEFSRKIVGEYQLVETINKTGLFRNWFELLDY